MHTIEGSCVLRRSDEQNIALVLHEQALCPGDEKKRLLRLNVLEAQADASPYRIVEHKPQSRKTGDRGKHAAHIAVDDLERHRLGSCTQRHKDKKQQEHQPFFHPKESSLKSLFGHIPAPASAAVLGPFKPRQAERRSPRQRQRIQSAVDKDDGRSLAQ